MTHRIATSFLLIASNLVLSCSGKDNTPSTPAIDWTAGRGTAACREWQRAFCELAAKCGTTTLTACANQMQQIACNSDATAASCATSLDAATCAAPPASCNMTDVLDATPAIQGCNDFLTAVCTLDTKCGSTTPLDTCVTQQLTTINCANAIGLALDYQDCLTQINAAACTSTAMPAVCIKAILLHQ